MSQPYKLVIFDWDGTLMDSLALIVASMQAASQQLQLRLLAAEQIHEIIGLGLVEAIARLYPDLDEVQLEQFRQFYSEHYINQNQHAGQFYTGVLPMLQALQQTPVLLSVATGKSRRGLDRVMRGCGVEAFFASSRCADETASKPDPLMLHELLALHQVAPEQAVMIGDTEFDMEMAVNAGVDRCAVGWGAHALPRLQVYQPQAAFEQVSELDAWLRKVC